MKANDLRLGNWVNTTIITPDLTMVLGVTDKFIYYSPCNNGEFDEFFKCLFCYVKPIPLTEEWLIKFGFESWGREEFNEFETDYNWGTHNIIDGTGDLIVFKRRCDYNDGDGVYYEWFLSMDGDVINTLYELEYVHQLQNLYFALTGNELEIK